MYDFLKIFRNGPFPRYSRDKLLCKKFVTWLYEKQAKQVFLTNKLVDKTRNMIKLVFKLLIFWYKTFRLSQNFVIQDWTLFIKAPW